MKEHLVIFDGECPFCHRAVRHILAIDVHRHFIFAPLNGETARDILIGPQKPLVKANSLVLVEDYQSTTRKFWVRSRAIFRIYWLVGNGWGWIGILSFLPSFLGDLFYKWFANHRHQFKIKMPHEPWPQDRLLP